MERLQPLEKLDKDYYLGERDGWYSDGENRDSESSDDELRETLSKLAGVRRECKPSSSRGGKGKAGKRKDEFESDMDDELDEQLVAHASGFMASSPKKSVGDTSQPSSSKASADVEDEEMPPLEPDTDEEDAGCATSERRPSASILKRDPETERQRAGQIDGGVLATRKKSVSIKEEPQILGNLENDISSVEDESKPKKAKSAFDDKDNLLRKAVDKAARDSKKEPVEFYDSDEDEDNERWVREHRQRMKLVPPQSNKQNGKANDPESHRKHLEGSDAVLSCPACMSLLTRDCQRHEFYKDQYRAMFVENCTVVMDQTLFMPQTGRKKNKAAKNKSSELKPNTFVSPSEAVSVPKEDLFHPVRCTVCSTNVGVYDSEEIYHFFNVLTGYA